MDKVVERLFRLDGFRCHYCQRLLTRKTATRDHKIPKSLGGCNHISNLVLSCGWCNSAKGSMTDLEFLAIPYEDREKLRRGIKIQVT